jgi:ribose 5-phosphate isomerase B
MIYLATDHRGFNLKEKIKLWLKEWGYDYEDMGAFEFDQNDDYPDFISEAAQRVSQNPKHSMAIILGSSGQGEAMVANRYKGVRAIVFYGPSDKFEIIKLGRQHNDSNVLSLGASFLNDETAKEAIKIWLETPFSGEERHIRRISKF